MKKDKGDSSDDSDSESDGEKIKQLNDIKWVNEQKLKQMTSKE